MTIKLHGQSCMAKTKFLLEKKEGKQKNYLFLFKNSTIPAIDENLLLNKFLTIFKHLVLEVNPRIDLLTETVF